MNLKLKRCLCALSVVTVLITTLPVWTFSSAAEESLDLSAADTNVYSAATVQSALLAENPNAAARTVLSAVLLPTSFDIKIPKLDPLKVKSAYSPLLSEMGEFETFREELAEHGINAETAAKMTYQQYTELESSWPMNDKHIDIFKKLYPELKDADLTGWTIGDSSAYSRSQDAINFAAQFSETQLAEMSRRGIQVEDMHYLLKEFHQTDVVLAQPDSVLKNTLEDCYRFDLDMKLGGEAGSQIEAKAENTAAVAASTPPSDKYTQVNFPLYGIDYFHNDVTTSVYHQLPIYDSDHPDGAKTYSFLHMTGRTTASNIWVGSAMGTQGKEGNASGYHVHFEVHSGNTATLSSGSDHVVGSISPYRLTEYIGEAAQS